MNIDGLYQHAHRLLSTALAQGKITQVVYTLRRDYFTTRFEEAGSRAEQMVICKAIIQLCK